MPDKLAIIKRGVAEIIPEVALVKKLEKAAREGKSLRIKYGIDPTGSDVHIGHLVPIRKMREFQDMGHTGVIIIGDFTAQIGDPTGKDATRPPLSTADIEANCARYMEQLYMVLDPAKTEVRYQTEWFGKMQMADVLNLMSKFTLAQFMAHETFRSRYENGLPLAMHEIMYPLLQAYDSVAIKADVELGATEQKFNILAGRDMQRYFHMEEQVALLMPILVGTDGKQKMGKSLNNYIAVFDAPNDKYGKVMSIPDEIIINYFTYATNYKLDEIASVKARLEGGENPKILKQLLAREIVTIYHGADAATSAEAAFNALFAKKEIPAEMPECTITEKTWVIKVLTENGLCKSGGEARRLIKQNAISINGDKVANAELELEPNTEYVIKVGKRRFLRVKA